MRNLTAKQKKLLDKWYLQQIARGKQFTIWWKVDEDDDFSYELYEEIEGINPCEMLYQNINNYITDKL